MNVPLAFFVIVSTISGGIAAGGITSGTVVGICVSISIFSGFVALDIMIKRAAKNHAFREKNCREVDELLLLLPFVVEGASIFAYFCLVM